MGDVYKELDDVKAQIERLKSEVRVKTELSEGLKKAHSEQLIKYQEAKQETEKQAQELIIKLEEISQAKQVSETLQSCLREKESSLRHLTSLHEKLRVDSENKLYKLEGENKELAFALDEVTERNKELEQNFCASTKEIEGLKRLLSTSERNCFEAEQKAQEAKELRHRDDIILELEEENRNAHDQLKWKKEQFRHLEEAHRRLQDQFQLSKEEWEREKSALVEEISLLQTSLDSQTRILEGVQKRLEMCNQVLAHEESRRKFLEIEVSEFKSRYENVFVQCEQERSKFESLTVQRDEEIAKLRNSLSTKEPFTKEMEFRIVHLEQENQELRESLKELQEAQIRNYGSTALTKLRNKLRGLEQVHSNCSTILKAKESELSFQIEKLKGDISRHNSELKGKEKQIQELQMELESYHSMIEVLKEEISVVLTIYKSEFSEAYSKRSDAKTEMPLCNRMDDKISLLTRQLEMKSSDLINVHLQLEQEHEKVKELMKRVRSLELTEQQQVIMEEEIQQHKMMLEESSAHQLYMEEKFLRMEGEKRDVSEALEKTNLELAKKIREVSQLKYELQNLESSAESLKVCCEENQEKCRQMENSLLAQSENEEVLKHEKERLITIIKEQNNNVEVLHQQIVLLEATVAAKRVEVEALTQDKEDLIKNVKEKDSCIVNLQKDITWMKQESMKREAEAAILAGIDAEKSVGQEKERLFKVINEKDQNIKNLQVLASSLEEDLTSAFVLSFSEVVENLLTTEALKKAKHMTELVIEEKNKKIVDLEKEVSGLGQRLIHQKEALFTQKQQEEELQALLEANEVENDKLMGEHRRLEGIVKQLEFEKGVLLQDTTKLSKEREELLVHIEEFCDHIGEFTCDDVKMMNFLETMLQRSKLEVGPAMNFTVDDELYDFSEENANASFYASATKLDTSAGRSPLKEVNQRQL
ncbi:hypothetical protein PRUPE_8G069900 [Prunus persica]|uniref:Uncharacterized protein n=1 Tax=Prunus persica TaxID=3760 RepID=A0A251MUD9_PRUPE|nr:uncharacterized protein At4g38062 [Prunus persica]XP_020425142.1 uncharacterized protein At4g38062 [Prunus persica]ONH90701.1 hypothetical protein PRUPE_8G069900 [Prunus persica]ONH90702.1 hypothetical protein PRUPE_8G069900 [Prunus persica]